jgi:hypothetical protein
MRHALNCAAMAERFLNIQVIDGAVNCAGLINDLTHARQRSEVALESMVAANLFREFAPQIPKPVRLFFALLAR